MTLTKWGLTFAGLDVPCIICVGVFRAMQHSTPAVLSAMPLGEGRVLPPNMLPMTPEQELSWCPRYYTLKDLWLLFNLRNSL